MNIKVSVIIPVYNTRMEYLQHCVNSVLRQTYRNTEIILVDDGSQKECADDIDRLAEQDDRILVFHNENCGVSSARNFGVRKAKGDYITFVDSDDVVNLRMIEHAVQIIEETGAEFVIGGVIVSSNYGEPDWHTEKSPEYRILEEKDKSSLQAHNLDMSEQQFRNINGGKITRGPYARFIAAETARRCSFLQGIAIGEDLLWNSQVIEQVEKIAIAKESWYCYVQHNESVTHVYNPSLELDLGKEMTEISRRILAKHPNLQKNYDNLLCEEITSKYVKRYLMHKDCPMTKEEKRQKLRELLQKYPFRRVMECPIYYNKAGIKILLIKTNLIFAAYSIKRMILHENQNI